MNSNNVILGYWAVRGRAGIIRQFLDYCGIPFTNKTYIGGGEWFGKDKHSLGFEFPNIPYLIDGDKKITESNVILSYIAIRSGKKALIGDTPDKIVQIQMAISFIGEMRYAIAKLNWTKKGDYEAQKAELFTTGVVKPKLEALNKSLENKEWICGFFSLADFELFEQPDLIHDMEASRLEPYPNLVKFREKFLEIPEVKAHRSSENFIKIWLPSEATWSNH